MPASFTIRSSSRLETLARALAEQLAAAPLAPLQPETIIVPGQGMARWLTLELARRLGSAASLELPFPGAFLERLCGPGPATAAFERSALQFRIFRLLGDARVRSRLGAAARYCQDDADQQKRFQLAERLAACFDDYQLYRPDALLAWERDETRTPELPHERWQAQLWRALLREFGGAGQGGPAQGFLFGAPSPAGSHRLERLRTLLADGARARAALPPRLSVFGLPTLAPAFVDLLQQIAAHVPVTLWLQQPTPRWPGGAQPPPRRAAPAVHPLLERFGQQAREFAGALAERGLAAAPAAADAFPDPGTDTLLAALQSDLLHQRTRGPTGDAPALPLDPTDVSLRVHGAHSRMRELEIVRDQLLAAFDRDPTLQPGDVMVLVPDVQEYTPYVHAVFAPVRKWLPFALADRSPASDLPAPATFLALCRAAAHRFAAPELLLLLEEPVLARTFGIARADLPVLRAWVARAAIRWGIDGPWRQRELGLPADGANAWQPGLARLLVGQATGPGSALVFDLLPAADATAARSDLLGRFLAWFDAIAAFGTALAAPHTLPDWAALLDDAAARLFTAVDDQELAGLDELQAAARRLRELQGLADLREELSAPAFVRWLEQELAARGESRGFLTGAITVAALRPMRALPVRILCLCGLHDGSFPRREVRQPFDLLQLERRALDRSRRTDDRQLFLDALLAARDQLVLTYVARSSKDDSVCAPSPVLSELLEHVEQAFRPPAGHDSARAFVFVQHPLQVWSPRYGDRDERLFTYADAVPARESPAAPATPAAATPATPAAAIEVIELADLLAFWRHPSRFHCRRVLGLSFTDDDDDGGGDDVEPFALGGLDAWRLRTAGVEALLRQRADPTAGALARATGLLPPAGLGEVEQRRLASEVRRLLLRVRAVAGDGRREIAVRGHDWLVRGELEGLHAEWQMAWRAATVRPKDRLRAWIRHLVLCAAAADDRSLPRCTLQLGTDLTLRYGTVLDAHAQLEQVVAGFREGRRTPLPVFEHASPAFAERLDKGEEQALDAARQHYDGNERDEDWQYDRGDPWVQYCWRDLDPIATPAFQQWARAVIGPSLGSAEEERP